MRKVLKSVSLVFALGLFSAGEVQGQLQWDMICGGDNASSGWSLCASVHLSFAASDDSNGYRGVTMDVWNFSEFAPGDNAATVFTKIGFFNVHENVAVVTSEGLTMSGLSSGGEVLWTVRNDIGGNPDGLTLDFGATTGTNNTPVDGGIASGVAHDAGTVNPSSYWYSTPASAVTFSFKVDNFSDWALNETGVLVKGQSMGGGEGEGSSTLIWREPPNVVPEPGTVILLATGLMGLGGAAWVRRRREDEV